MEAGSTHHADPVEVTEEVEQRAQTVQVVLVQG